MKKSFTFTEGTHKKRHRDNEFTASFVKKVLFLLGIMLLPNMSNAAIRRFEVTKTSYVYIDNEAKADPGSLPAAVDSVNKYSTDSCAIIFNLKANDTIKVTSHVAKEISNETYTLIDGGKNGAKIATYNNYFSISNANHVVLKNLEFVDDTKTTTFQIKSSVVDTITNCKFTNGNGITYGALYLPATTVTSINNCLFSGKNIGLTIDASASATISDCQFLNNSVRGIDGGNNENLILRNCTISGNTEGIRKFSGKAYNCVFKSNESASYTGSGDFYNCIFSQNSTAAINGSAHVINKCRFTENGTAIKAIQNEIDSICNSYIGNNETGIYTSQTTIKNIIGDTIVSNQAHGIYIAGICTHIYNNVISDNNVGMEIVRTTIDSISGNTITSNKTSGVIINGRGVLNVFSNNYIGTNSNFEALGNGEDGVSIATSSTVPSEFKNNFIGNNGRYGINFEGGATQFTIESCYVGVTPDSTPMPNAKGGLYIHQSPHKTVLKNSFIARNGSTGVKTTTDGNLTITGCSIYKNKGYGVYSVSEYSPYNLVVDNCVFEMNDSSAIYTSYPHAGEGSSYVSSSITNTLFLKTTLVRSINKAIETNNPLSAPVITSIKEDEDGYLIITGKADSIGASYIELYLNDGKSEIATKLIASDSTDAEGNFSIKTGIMSYAASFSATSSYSNETSALSKTYSYYSKNRKEYFVKMDGTGNGSSWENAMDGKGFVSMMERVPDSVTFHLAAGTYDLQELAEKTEVQITRPTTIIGSYPADAKTGDVATPFKNTTLLKTGYFRINTSGDVVFDGLRFETEFEHGAYNEQMNKQPGLTITLKNSVVVGKENSTNAIFASHKGKTILYNDSIIGNHTYSAIAVNGSDTLIAKNCYVSGSGCKGGIVTDGYAEIDSTIITGNMQFGVFQNGTGGQMTAIKNCIITRDGSVNDKEKGIGIRMSGNTANIINNLVGIDANGDVKGFDIGVLIEMTTISSIVEGNIIAGNDSIGIVINGGTNLVKGNYIGTDKNFNDLGNGSDGLLIGARSKVNFPSSLDSANYIGFNKRHGIFSQGTMTACNASFNYIGVTPQGDPMPNGEYGIYMETSRQDQNIKGNLIGFNGKGGVHYEDYYTTITENLFFGTNGKAISDRRTSYQLAIPSIIQVKKDNDRILVEGTTDTFRVSTVELFATNGGLQTAHVFLGNTVTDSTGAFSFAIPAEKLSGHGDTICFSATATYKAEGTSNLSDPFCCENCQCVTDTTILPIDTIYVGEKFLDITYTEAGFYDDIYEVLKRPNGCELVVKYRLVVLSNEGTGVENQLAGNKSIYPNPATDVLHVTNCSNFVYMIQDMLGHTVMGGSSSNGSINISDLPQGFYFLKLGDEGRDGVFQFVKSQK